MRPIVEVALGALEAAGGFSLSLACESPDTGYMVSLPGRECRIADGELTSAILAEYVEANTDLLALPGNYLGGWRENGTVYLDVSVNIPDRARALALAVEYGQLAIYDIGSQETVYVQ